MTRNEILKEALGLFYKQLPIFCDTLTPEQLEKLELDLRRLSDEEESRKYIILANIVMAVLYRNCGEV
jgi:hypothetical protein